MEISHKEAVKIAIKKFGTNEVFVGNGNEVWNEAKRRAHQNYLPDTERVNTDRLDGVRMVERNEDEEWETNANSKIYTNEKGEFYYVLFPEIPEYIKEKLEKLEKIEAYASSFPTRFDNMDVIEILRLFKQGGYKTKKPVEQAIEDYEFLMR